MKICQPKIIRKGNDVVISTRVESTLGTNTLWFSLHHTHADLVCDYADASLVALLIPAMATGETIYLEGSLSERLFHSLSKHYQCILQHEIPWLKRVDIIPREVVVRQQRAMGVASGFSAGVDSFCLLKDYHYSPFSPHFKLTHLLFNNVGSNGSGSAGEALFEKRYSYLSQRVSRFALPFIKINSNLDAFYAPFGVRLDFEQTTTCRNAAVALLLQNGIQRYLYASTYSYESIGVAPTINSATSDPMTLPLLSTETLDSLSVGSEYTRVQKTLNVAEIPDSYECLNVCVNGTVENCAQCWKCLRTLATFDIGGVIKNYAQVFNLAIYHQQRERYFAALLMSNDPLLMEIVDFAKQRGFRIPSASRRLAHWYRLLNRFKKTFSRHKMRAYRSAY